MAAITFDHITKEYQLGTSASLREALTGWGRRLAGRGTVQDAPFRALDDVSFQVQPGEIVGLIGQNGAGKSTALKLLSGITHPTRGRIHTSGRVAALIELGAGFHPDLTGRENVFLAGSVLGLTRREVAASFDRIVAFAELEQFIDTPVKRYSSGMYVRLAFAVAAHVRSDILLIDEVLSVGDAMFQRRCLETMQELHRAGTTIVFVSHDLWTVQSFCQRALLFGHGRVLADDTPSVVIEQYREQERRALMQEADVPETSGDASVVLALADATVPPGGQVSLELHYHTSQPIERPVLLVRIRRADGLICCALHNRAHLDAFPQVIDGDGSVLVDIGPLPLVPDVYTIEALLLDEQRPIIYAASGRELLRISGPLTGSNDAGVFAPPARWYAERMAGRR